MATVRITPSSSLRLAPAALLVMVLVLCAFGAQQWVAYTHWHGAAAAQITAQAPAGDTGEGRRSDCLLCQIASHAASAAPPSAVPQQLPAAQPFLVRLAAGIGIEVPALPAHAWQSRGPPAA